MSFLPEIADDLVAQRRRAVSEGTVVSLQYSHNQDSPRSNNTLGSQTSAQDYNSKWAFTYFSTGGIVKEVAVISMVAHISCSVAGARNWDNEVTAFTPSSVQGQQDTVKKARPPTLRAQ